MSKKCPHCEEEIISLDYRADTVEFGTWSERDGYESSDSEFSGDTTFYCPECEEEITTDWRELDDFEDEESDEIKNQDKEQESEELRPLWQPAEQTWSPREKNYRKLDVLIAQHDFTLCECGQVIRKNNGEKGLTCPRCHTEIEILDK
jgi:predicted RNA-binding Zn-ribbon protein involved in translation (DUF1610 family)